MANEFDVKAFVEGLKTEIAQKDGDYGAMYHAQGIFDAQHPDETEPKYKCVENVPPVMISHSAGYVGVQFRDGTRDTAEITLLFSNRKDLSEVRMTYKAMIDLRDSLTDVLNRYDEAKVVMNRHAEAVAEYQERRKERSKLREQVGSVASALWKRLKKQKKLVTVESEAERLAEEIPF